MTTLLGDANGAGSLLEKRHSRSLDLSNLRNNNNNNSFVHQRSASVTDGLKIEMNIEQNRIPTSQSGSIFSLYKRKKSSISSAFSSLLQQQETTTKLANYRFSSPILNTGKNCNQHFLFGNFF